MAMPSASFEGRLLHADLCEQAAAYAFHISQNHPFVDGNNRTALAAALVFLDLNGIELADTDKELYTLMMKAARGSLQKAKIAEGFHRLSVKKRPRG